MSDTSDMNLVDTITWRSTQTTYSIAGRGGGSSGTFIAAWLCTVNDVTSRDTDDVISYLPGNRQSLRPAQTQYSSGSE